MSQHKQCSARTLSSRQCLKSVSNKDPENMFCFVHLNAPHKEVYKGQTKHYYRSTSGLPKVRQEHYNYCHSMKSNEQECKKNNDVCMWTRKNCQRAFGKKHALKALQRWAPAGQESRWEDSKKW